MPSNKTHGDKIEELQKLMATLIERVDNMRGELGANTQAVGEMARQFSDFRVEFIAVSRTARPSKVGRMSKR